MGKLYIKKIHLHTLASPWSKTYLENPAPEEPDQSNDQVSLDEETVMHRVRR